MVVQNAIDNLKDKPHEEKKAVASGIAIGVVIILLVGWGFLFLRKIQKGATTSLEGGAVPSDQFNAQFLEQTKEQINQVYKTSSDELQNIRDTAAQNQVQGSAQNENGTAPTNVDGFGAENTNI